MFLSSDYILGNELVQKMQIHIANISILKLELENAGNYEDIIKMNNCTFVNTKSNFLPKYIRMGILEHEFTDMSDKLPCTYARSAFECSEKDLKNAGILNKKIKIADKDFYVFEESFIQKIKGKVVNILDRKETMDCDMSECIEGYIQLSKNKFITWY